MNNIKQLVFVIQMQWVHCEVESSWNVMAHGDAREGKWRGNWRMECVASTLTLPPALLPLMRTPRLPVVDWTDAPAGLNGLVHFGKRQNLVSARVPSHFKCSLTRMMTHTGQSWTIGLMWSGSLGVPCWGTLDIELWNNLQHTPYFYVFWLSCHKFLNT